MRCAVCKIEGSFKELLEGLVGGEMVLVCENCAKIEGIPTITKPSREQLERADEMYSVRERMEKIAGLKKESKLNKEYLSAQENIARLKVPLKKDKHDKVVDDYNWRVIISRRRRKMSQNQLAREINIAPHIIMEIERGRLPKDFENVLRKLENYFGIKLLKVHEPEVSYTKRGTDYEKKILEAVRKKIEEREKLVEKKEITEELFKDLEEGKIDFSKREEIKDITLNDLIEMKRLREKRELSEEKKAKLSTLIGDEIEIEEI